MHELSISHHVVAVACEQAGSARVRAVRVRIGRLTGIDVRAVTFCYELCAQGTTSLDADRLTQTGAPIVQLNTGKGCHLEADMIYTALQQLAPRLPHC